MSGATMPEWIQRRLLRRGVALVPNAEFRQDPDTGQVTVNATRGLPQDHYMLCADSVLAHTFARQQNMNVARMAGWILPAQPLPSVAAAAVPVAGAVAAEAAAQGSRPGDDYDDTPEPVVPLTYGIVDACQGGDLSVLRHSLSYIRTLAPRELEALLLFAAERGTVSVVHFLAKMAGADLNATYHRLGRTALLVAAEHNHHDLMRFMVTDLGADVDYPWPCQRTALHMACVKGDRHLMRVLIELGADVNRLDPVDGRSLLFVAAVYEHQDVCRILLKHGADPRGGSNDEGTAAEISAIIHGPEATLTAYLVAKSQCSRPHCPGTGLKKCQGCKQARYCGDVDEDGHTACQLDHWKAHRAQCKATRSNAQ